MTLLQPPWPDAEDVLCDYLADLGMTRTATPNPLVPPVIRVLRVGGSDDGITDRPRVMISCYGDDRSASWHLAEACRQRILAMTGEDVNGVLCDKASTDTPAQLIPDDSDDAERVEATYRFAFRRMFDD